MLVGNLLIPLLMLSVELGHCGRWDHHKRNRKKTTTIKPHIIRTTTSQSYKTTRSLDSPISTVTRSPNITQEQCQILPHLRRVGNRELNADYIDKVKRLRVEDKAVLSPIVFKGVMVSRTNTFKSMYFVSFKILKVLKGQIDSQLRGQVRLLFRTQRGRRQWSNCPPVKFNIKSGRYYLVFVRKLVRKVGRYVAVLPPEVARKKKLKGVNNSLKIKVRGPSVKMAKTKSVTEGKKLRLKCKITNRVFPAPIFSWYKDGILLSSNRRVNIKSKKKKSLMTVMITQTRDRGQYTCVASNLMSTQSQNITVTVKNGDSPYKSQSSCPIQSYCLNGGSCLYYQSILELVCRCTEGFTGQRCQFKKASKLTYYNSRNGTDYGCGLYGYDINRHCSGWREAPYEMTALQYQEWLVIQDQESNLRKLAPLSSNDNK